MRRALQLQLLALAELGKKPIRKSAKAHKLFGSLVKLSNHKYPRHAQGLFRFVVVTDRRTDIIQWA